MEWLIMNLSLPKHCGSDNRTIGIKLKLNYYKVVEELMTAVVEKSLNCHKSLRTNYYWWGCWVTQCTVILHILRRIYGQCLICDACFGIREFWTMFTN